MPVKPNKASLAKTLSIIMLVVFSTMEMATAVGLPEDAQVSDTLHVDHTPLALRHKRYLRSAADVKSSGVKVRRLLAFDKLLAGLGKSTISYFEAKMLQHQLQQQTSSSVFTYLQLDKMEKNLFDSPKFRTWVAYVKVTTRTKEEAIAEMSRTLWAIFPENRMVKLLGGVEASHEFGDVAKRLREHQMGMWTRFGRTAEKAFTCLGLDKVSKNELIGSPEFTMWGAFMTKKHESYSDAFKCLTTRLEVEDLLRALTAIHDNNENFSFAQSLIFDYLWNLRNIKKVTPVQLYGDLKLANLPFPELSNVEQLKRPKVIVESLLKDPLNRMWFDYVYMWSFQNWHINENQVKRNLIQVFDKRVGTEISRGLQARKDFNKSKHRILKKFGELFKTV
ncbi:unnamed protein product [Peronospora destructor]|uniref:RxLR effector protein n=1 Tax=Peronospora destructor TaxID=86335 RepID=A0AAV0V3T1_9STRA|nr:unnamed protein product [Peronospora destructor]